MEDQVRPPRRRDRLCEGDPLNIIREEPECSDPSVARELLCA